MPLRSFFHGVQSSIFRTLKCTFGKREREQTNKHKEFAGPPPHLDCNHPVDVLFVRLSLGRDVLDVPGTRPQVVPGDTLPRHTGHQSKNRKWGRQTGVRQLPPLSTIGTRYGNSVSTASMRRRCLQNQRVNSASSDSPLQRIKEKSRYGISVSTPHRRYGHRLRTPFLRTPFPRLLTKFLYAVFVYRLLLFHTRDAKTWAARPVFYSGWRKQCFWQTVVLLE